MECANKHFFCAGVVTQQQCVDLCLWDLAVHGGLPLPVVLVGKLVSPLSVGWVGSWMIQIPKVWGLQIMHWHVSWHPRVPQCKVSCHQCLMWLPQIVPKPCIIAVFGSLLLAGVVPVGFCEPTVVLQLAKPSHNYWWVLHPHCVMFLDHLWH